MQMVQQYRIIRQKRTLMLKVLCMDEKIKKHEKVFRSDVGSKSCLSFRNKTARKKQPLTPATAWARDTDRERCSRAETFFSYQ